MSSILFGILFVGAIIGFAISVIVGMFLYVKSNYIDKLLRIFQQKPPFIIPRGEKIDSAEDVCFPAVDGRNLRGCYLKTEAPERKGVILFGLEFGSNRWSCQPYCEQLLKNGYDVFAFEPRNQGESDSIPTYEPLHWLTRYEFEDTLTAVEYLIHRPDAMPQEAGIGFFGISKGGSAGLMAASHHKSIRCVVTDGAFATVGTMIPYMRKFAKIYSNKQFIQDVTPDICYGLLARSSIGQIARIRQVEYVHIEPAMKKLKRPLMMIHGEKDTLIRVSMAQDLYKRAAQPKRFWVVPGAKHNQALHIAGQEYHDNVQAFFDYHLAGIEPGTKPVSVDMPTAEQGQSKE